MLRAWALGVGGGSKGLIVEEEGEEVDDMEIARK